MQTICQRMSISFLSLAEPVADPGFPVGRRRPRRGRRLPRQLCFENFACRNESIWSLRGRGRAPGTPHRSPNVDGNFNLQENVKFWSVNCRKPL